MTMFIQLVDGQPVGHAIIQENFHQLHPDISFAWPFVAEDIEPLGFGLYDFSSQPDRGTFEKAVEVAPIKDEYGRWRQTWAVETMTQEEVAARIEQEWSAVRGKRNFLLACSDWTQLDDTPLANTAKQQWAAHRQALRDLPDAQTDPFNIGWPAIPA